MDPIPDPAPADDAAGPAPSAPASPSDPEARAAAALAGAYRTLPGVVPALIGGATLPAVQASLAAARAAYAEAQQAILQAQSAALPPAHHGGAAAPIPTDPFSLIRLGVTADA